MMRHSPGSASRSRSSSPPTPILKHSSPRTRPRSGSSGQFALPLPPGSPSHQQHYAEDRFWCRIFTRCRVFLVGLFLGGFIAQSFTAALSLCVHHPDFNLVGNGLSINSFTHGASAALAPYLNEKQQIQKKQTQQQEPTSDELIPIETQPGNYSHIRDFDRQPGVVIATKIHGPDFVSQLRQSLCLLKAAYNDRMRYDILVFTTIPLSDHDTTQLTEIVHPANLRIETDPQTLHDQIKSMTRLQRMHLKKRCKVNTTDDLFWWTRCCEEGANGICMSLAYTWQSEFRAKHLWTHEAIKPYKTMMWFDSDAMPTRVWDRDPVAAFARNQLKILLPTFPKASRRGKI